jgi:hypothetical protein
VSSGIPPATAAAATAVEARNLLRLGAAETGVAFGVIASTLHGAPGHPAVEPSAAVSRVELAELKRSAKEKVESRGTLAVEALRCCCEVK